MGGRLWAGTQYHLQEIQGEFSIFHGGSQQVPGQWWEVQEAGAKGKLQVSLSLIPVTPAWG